MTITATVNEKIGTLSIEGRIDTVTAPQLEQTFADYAQSCDKIIFDLSDTDYISSAGLRVILIAHREMQKKGGLVLRNLSKNVESVITLTGFDRIVCIE